MVELILRPDRNNDQATKTPQILKLAFARYKDDVLMVTACDPAGIELAERPAVRFLKVSPLDEISKPILHARAMCDPRLPAPTVDSIPGKIFIVDRDNVYDSSATIRRLDFKNGAMSVPASAVLHVTEITPEDVLKPGLRLAAPVVAQGPMVDAVNAFFAKWKSGNSPPKLGSLS